MKKYGYIACAILCVGMMGLSACNTPSGDGHDHSFDTEWTSNSEYHWHRAVCGHDVTDGKAKHTIKDGSCTVCKYKVTESGEHVHTYEAGWTTDADYHWHKATCGHDEIDGKAEHSFENGSCTECKYMVTVDGDGAVVTFDAADGAFSTGQTKVGIRADENDKVAISDSPVKSGYAFDGWYNGSTQFDATKAYTADVTFTAKYVSGDTDEVYDALFDEDSVVSVKIDMSDGEWKKLSNDLDKNSQSPIYRLADSVTIGVKTENGKVLEYYYDEVGVRLKGNTSRRKFYGDDGFYASVHYKLSFKQTFDDEDEYEESERKQWDDKNARSARKDRKFATMEKIDVKWNSTKDDTYVKELYALKLFRENGIATQNATLCSMTARNKNEEFLNLGVYKLYEPIDEAFLTRRFPNDDKGDLYKCTWGQSSNGSNFTTADGTIGVEDELKFKFYTYDKKTNKKKDANGNRDFSSMQNFIAGVNAHDADYEELIDTDYFAKFEAINYVLGNPDCIRNHYNNFYTYFRSDGKAIFIPYDYDRCLGLTDWNPTRLLYC